MASVQEEKPDNFVNSSGQSKPYTRFIDKANQQPGENRSTSYDRLPDRQSSDRTHGRHLDYSKSFIYSPRREAEIKTGGQGLEHRLYNQMQALNYPSPSNIQRSLFETVIKKAYNAENMHSSVILDQAKDALNETELRMLNRILSMRGSYNLTKNIPTINKGS